MKLLKIKSENRIEYIDLEKVVYFQIGENYFGLNPYNDEMFIFKKEFFESEEEYDITLNKLKNFIEDKIL